MKCIATDMDGTLLNKDGMISEGNRRALEAVMESGGQVVVATGRNFKEARFVLDQADITCPIISMNGAIVLDEEGNIIESSPLDEDNAKETIAILESKDFYFELYTNKGTYSKDFKRAVKTLMDIFETANPDVDLEKIKEKVEARIERGLVFETKDYNKLVEEKDLDVYKILIFSPNEDLLNYITLLLNKIDGLTITSSGIGNVEINSERTSKGKAVLEFLRSKGISPEDTMTIGDNFNDVSMFEVAGMSVAMGNAPDEIKQLAIDVTDTNDNDGVAKAIYKHMLDSE